MARQRTTPADVALHDAARANAALASCRQTPRRVAWQGLEPVQIGIAADAVISQLELSGFTIVRSSLDYRGSFAAR